MMNSYLPRMSNMKAPLIPGRIMAQMAITPHRKINQSVLGVSTGIRLTMMAAIAENGRAPADHLIAFRTLRTMTVLASERPFTDDEINNVRTFIEQRGFDAVYFPGIQPSDLNQHNILPEPAYHNLFVDILQNPEMTYDAYRYDIHPPTDNHPFFFHYFKCRQTPEILAGLGMSWITACVTTPSVPSAPMNRFTRLYPVELFMSLPPGRMISPVGSTTSSPRT